VSDDPGLDRAAERAFAALAAGGGSIECLGELDRAIVVVTTAQGLIDNGGLRAFLDADFPGSPPYSLFVDEYRRVGVEEVAAAIAAATARYPFADPHRAGAERRAHHARVEADGGRLFDDLDAVACGCAEVWSALARFVREREYGADPRSRPPK